MERSSDPSSQPARGLGEKTGKSPPALNSRELCASYWHGNPAFNRGAMVSGSI